MLALFCYRGAISTRWRWRSLKLQRTGTGAGRWPRRLDALCTVREPAARYTADQRPTSGRKPITLSTKPLSAVTPIDDDPTMKTLPNSPKP